MRRSSRSNRNILLWILSLIIVASMVCGLIVTVLGGDSSRQPTDTPVPTVQRATSTPSVTPSGPQPSPQPLTTSAP
jgi:hypothetical protein